MVIAVIVEALLAFRTMSRPGRCAEGGRHEWDDDTFDPMSMLRLCGKCGVAE